MSSYYTGFELVTVMTEFVKDTIRPRTRVNALRAAALEQLPELANVDLGAPGCTTSREQALLRFVAASGQLAHFRRLNRPEEALGACEAALTAFQPGGLPGRFWSARTLSVKADLLRSLSRHEEAIAVCDEALGLPEPGEHDVAAAEDFFNAAIVDVLHTKATSLCEVGRSEAAADAYLEVERRFGESEKMSRRMDAAAALISRAMILDDMGGGQEALSQCNAVLDRFGAVGQAEMEEWMGFALLMKGDLLDRSDRPKEALVALDQALRRFENSDLPKADDSVLATFAAKGALLWKLGEEDAARAAFNDALERLRGEQADGAADWRARVQLLRGSLELDCKEYESAREAASEVLAHDPDGDPQLRSRAFLLRARSALFGAPAAAESDLAAALELLPALDSLPVETFDALAEAAVELDPARVLELIEGSASAESLLPLTTALELELGRAPRVAREVEEVAKDIRRSLATARRKRGATDEENPRPEREEPS